MPRRGDSCSRSNSDLSSDSDRSPSPVRNRGLIARRNDGDQSGPTDQIQESDIPRYHDLLTKRDDHNNTYANFEEKLNITVDPNNPCNYTQEEHIWLKGHCRSMDVKKRASISKRISALDITRQEEDRKNTWCEGKTLTRQINNMLRDEQYKTTRRKFDEYMQWIAPSDSDED